MRCSVLISVFVTGCAAAPMQEVALESWKGRCYGDFERDVSEVAGDTAIDCGFLSIQATDANRTVTKSCATKAVKSGMAFKFGYESLGYDSLYCDAAIRRPDGQLISFFFDSDVTGQMGSGSENSAVWTARCNEIKFKAGTMGVGSFFDLQGCTSAPEIFSNLASQK